MAQGHRCCFREMDCVSFALAIVMHHIARMLVEKETYGCMWLARPFFSNATRGRLEVPKNQNRFFNTAQLLTQDAFVPWQTQITAPERRTCRWRPVDRGCFRWHPYKAAVVAPSPSNRGAADGAYASGAHQTFRLPHDLLSGCRRRSCCRSRMTRCCRCQSWMRCRKSCWERLPAAAWAAATSPRRTAPLAAPCHSSTALQSQITCQPVN